MFWTMVHPRAKMEMLGYIPDFLSPLDERPAREQFAANYIGGWHPMQGFVRVGGTLRFAGDPPRRLIAKTQLGDELIEVYDGAWVCIVQPNGTFEASRMD